MKIDIKKLPKTIEELEKIILFQKQELDKKNLKIAAQQNEIISHNERYIRLLEKFKLEKSRHYATSSEKNTSQSDLFDEAGIELDGELKDQLDDTIDVEAYQRKRHPIRKPIPKDISCVFRPRPNADSSPSRTLIPISPEHSFQS
jgi:uncharacterized coiled-coil protein SlyX